MLQLKNKRLTTAVTSLLKQYQDAVNAKPTFADRAAEGKKLFSKYNKKTNAAFKVVRTKLSEMSGGTVRCNYCEDSNANQVEHIYPKNFFPDRCFVWKNYCYACGPCNQPKNDKFSIFENGSGLERNLKTDLPAGTKPPAGVALLLDPRIDSPLGFLFLDTKDTFNFVPFSTGNDKRRAEYTIEILGLNSRSYLVKARKIAFDNFRSRLFEYVHKKEAGVAKNKLAPLIDSFKNEHHQTVWHEMIRQRSLHTEIDELLNSAPEALNWI